jgi:hypothetical protein
MKSVPSLRLPALSLKLQRGGRLDVSVHTITMKVDGHGNLIQEERAWGPDPAGCPDGWSFTYTLCRPPDGHLRARDAGYWKTHHRGAPVVAQRMPWPIPEETMLGNRSWLEILRHPAGEDLWTILAQQWIAAQLNAATQGAAPSPVKTALRQGELLLREHPGRILAGRHAHALRVAAHLDGYNHGLGSEGEHADGQLTPPPHDDG